MKIVVPAHNHFIGKPVFFEVQQQQQPERIGKTENKIYAASLRMYNKLKRHEGIILKPALLQLQDLNNALQRGNPAMLEVNKAIATASEQSYKVSTLQAKGLLDAAACSAKLMDIEVKLAELRRERRQLLKNEDIEEVMDALRQTVDIIHNGPDRLQSFDEVLFADLVEKITVESQTSVRFHLGGGIELREQLRELAAQCGVSQLKLFGSRARGDNRERSDVDLAVWGLEGLAAGRLRLALEDLPTLLEFDLVCVDADTDPALLERIKEEGVMLYAADEV